MSNISNVQNHSILTSDHRRIALRIKVSYHKPVYKWRINPTLLFVTGFKEYMTKNIEDFLKINDNSETSDSALWEAFKATKRGAMSCFESAKRKEKQLKKYRNKLLSRK